MYTHNLVVLKFRNATGHAASVFQPPRRINASLKESPGCHGNVCQKSLHIVSSAFAARSPPPNAAPAPCALTVHRHLLLPLRAHTVFVAVGRLTLNEESGVSTEGQTGGCVSVGGARLTKVLDWKNTCFVFFIPFLPLTFC